MIIILSRQKNIFRLFEDIRCKDYEASINETYVRLPKKDLTKLKSDLKLENIKCINAKGKKGKGKMKTMYREIVVRAYGEEAIKKIDLIRNSGINMTELVLNAIIEADIKALTREKRLRLETMEVNATITNERAKFVIDMAQQAKVNISKFIERCFANYIVVEKALKELYGEAY